MIGIALAAGGVVGAALALAYIAVDDWLDTHTIEIHW